ncbi:MAG: hypothetical protein CR986_10430 [Ignavibacteriae bacterium]|nr:MAG: hypothetical protein CR986_10430 [Ignavibacteriota bacterium]
MILTKKNISEINSDKLLEESLTKNQLSEILIVVPTNRKLRDLKKSILNKFVDEPISKLNIETITTLSTNLLKEHKPFLPLSEAASTILIKESCEELELKYFSVYNRKIPFGTLDKIKNVISEYKKHAITPAILRNEAEKITGSEKVKALDIAKIYTQFQEKCLSKRVFDIGDIYSELLKIDYTEFYKNFNKLFGKCKKVALDKFDEFTNSEIEIISKVSDVVENNLFINFDYYITNKSLFSHLDNTYEILAKNGFVKVKDISPLEKNDFLNNTKKNLFEDKIIKANNKFQDKIYKIKVSNRIEEIEFIARDIKTKIIEEKIVPYRICIAFNVIGNYSNIVRDIFAKYGIPYNLTDRIQLKTSPPVIAAISLLELVENDFYFNDLINVFTNGFFKFKNIDLNNIILIANKLKITSGLENWFASIEDALKLLEYNTEDLNISKAKLKQSYIKAKDDIETLHKLLKPLKGRKNKAEFLTAFKNVLLEVEFPQKLVEDSGGNEEEFIKAVTLFFDTLEEVLVLITQDDETAEYPLHFYIEQIRVFSNWARFNVKEKSDEGILITSINEIRGLKFDYLYLGGMCDGDIPTKYSPEIFFSGSFKKKERIHQAEERYLFYQALSVWQKQLYLVLPQKNGSADLVESTFVKDLNKLFLFTEIEYKKNNIILCKEELLIAAGNQNINGVNEGAVKQYLSKLSTAKEVSKIRINEPFSENVYNGFLSGEDIKVYLEEYVEQQISISQLESFAKCPFEYFTKRILKIESLGEPNEEAAPIELGNVLHSILHDFYQKISDENIELKNTDSKKNAVLKEILFDIANEKIDKLNLKSPLAFFEKEKILGINGIKENSILYQFLLNETNKQSEFEPILFEVPFGQFENINSVTVKISNFKLRGKIDRIDLNYNDKSFNIIDYKLKGKKPTSKELHEGLSLQLPVYMIAGREILQDTYKYDYNGNLMIIYSLDYKKDNFGEKVFKVSSKRKLGKDEIMLQNKIIMENAEKKISEYYEAIKNGRFNLSKLDDRETKVCNYCDYQSLCRMKEIF